MTKTRTQKYYNTVIAEDLLIVYNSRNIMQQPQMYRAMLNISSKNFLLDKYNTINALSTCLMLSGQKSKLTRAQKSIAAFGLRQDQIIGCMATIRGAEMYSIFDKVISLVLPRQFNQSEIVTKTDFVENDALPNMIHFQTRGVKRLKALPQTLTQRSISARMDENDLPQESSKERVDLNYGITDTTLFPEIETLIDVLNIVQAINLSFSFVIHDKDFCNEKRRKASPNLGSATTYNRVLKLEECSSGNRLPHVGSAKGIEVKVSYIEKSKDKILAKKCLLFLSCFQSLCPMHRFS